MGRASFLPAVIALLLAVLPAVAQPDPAAPTANPSPTAPGDATAPVLVLPPLHVGDRFSYDIIQVLSPAAQDELANHSLTESPVATRLLAPLEPEPYVTVEVGPVLTGPSFPGRTAVALTMTRSSRTMDGGWKAEPSRSLYLDPFSGELLGDSEPVAVDSRGPHASIDTRVGSRIDSPCVAAISRPGRAMSPTWGPFPRCAMALDLPSYAGHLSQGLFESRDRTYERTAVATTATGWNVTYVAQYIPRPGVPALTDYRLDFDGRYPVPTLLEQDDYAVPGGPLASGRITFTLASFQPGAGPAIDEATPQPLLAPLVLPTPLQAVFTPWLIPAAAFVVAGAAWLGRRLDSIERKQPRPTVATLLGVILAITWVGLLVVLMRMTREGLASDLRLAGLPIGLLPMPVAAALVGVATLAGALAIRAVWTWRPKARLYGSIALALMVADGVDHLLTGHVADFSLVVDVWVAIYLWRPRSLPYHGPEPLVPMRGSGGGPVATP